MARSMILKAKQLKQDDVSAWNFPELATDAEIAVFLAKTYVKDGLSKIERYHGKFGDIGAKAMKKAMPELRLPKKFRCEHCIEGKIHKFGHGKAESGERISDVLELIFILTTAGRTRCLLGDTDTRNFFLTEALDFFGRCVCLRRQDTTRLHLSF